MELAGLEEGVPAGGAGAGGTAQTGLEADKAGGVEEAEEGAGDELGAGETNQNQQRLGQASEEDGPREGARHGAREGEVVVARRQLARRVSRRRPVHEHVVRRLYVERLLHLGVRRRRQVHEHERRDAQREQRVCSPPPPGPSGPC